MSLAAVFKISKGNRVGQEIRFDEKVAKVGRNHILDDGGVSRSHCLLEIDPTHVTVRDLGSLNGTYLNGENISFRSLDGSVKEAERVLLKPGDRLGLGQKSEITFLGIEDSEGSVKEKVFEKNDCPWEIPGYTIIGSIGKGGMGEVWLAEEKKTREQRAVKFMLPELLSRVQKRQWFMREISVGEQVMHPNIVNQYKNGKTKKGNVPYIVMEYCKGENLKQLMRREDLKIAFKKENGETGYEKIFGGKSDEALEERIKISTYILSQVLDGLHYIHQVPVESTLPDGKQTSEGLVFRDIKPENILLSDSDLSSNPIVKIVDFGLAKAFHFAGKSFGTPPNQPAAGAPIFIPRQQVRDYLHAKPEVDVWATAATCYYMITGFPPKDFEEGQNMYEMVILNDVIPIRERDPRIPANLAKVIDKALEEVPEIGIKTALELKIRINAALSL